MPTEWLTNRTFEAIFANGTKGDFFYEVEEIRAVTKEIIKQRKSNLNFKNPKGENLVTKGLFFDSNLMKKIVLKAVFSDKEKLGKLIASKFDIKFVSEKDEAELVEKFLAIMEDALLEFDKKAS